MTAKKEYLKMENILTEKNMQTLHRMFNFIFEEKALSEYFKLDDLDSDELEEILIKIQQMNLMKLVK
jgi:hypothetical protein